MDDDVGSVGSFFPGSVGFGCMVAIIGAVSCGASMVLQKVGVKRSRKIWLVGLLCLVVGEILTVVAYTHAPAVLVSPLGAVRVIVTTLLSVRFLGEKLTRTGKFGILISTLGSMLIVYHAPKHNTINTFDALQERLSATGFMVYFAISLAVTLFLIFRVAPHHGTNNLFVYVSVTNIIGAIGVLLSKGIGIVIGSIILGNINHLFDFTTWFVIVGEIVGAVSQLYFLNLSLKHFDAAVIAPLKYVGTNILVVIGSCILYQEFDSLTITYVDRVIS